MKIIRPYQPLGQLCDNLGDNLVERGASSVLDLKTEDVILIGTPWFWDGCQISEKYQWLEQQLDAHPGSRFIALGIVSCLSLGSPIEWLLKGETVEPCKRIWSRFKTITVRDPLAYEFLTAIGVESKLLPCPSVLCLLPDVTPTPGSELFIDATCWHKSMEEARSAIHVPGGDRFTYQSGLCDSNRLDSMLRFWMGYESIVSVRIHAILPLLQARKISVVPTDSRALTATHLGVPAWPDEPKLTPLDTSIIRSQYLDTLNSL